jgi:hypothetical protein
MTIHRFHNYPHTRIHENQNEPPTSTYYGVERTYELRINDDTGIFTLNISPDQKVVIDTFEDISFRKYLYQQLEDGAVYDWMIVSWKNHQKDNGSLKEGRTTTPDSIEYFVKTDGGEYMLRMDKKTGLCRYSSQEKAREFDLEDLYLVIPELPLLASGEVNRQIRQMMEDDETNDLPRTPYELGFTISNKDQAA